MIQPDGAETGVLPSLARSLDQGIGIALLGDMMNGWLTVCLVCGQLQMCPGPGSKHLAV